MLEKYVKYVSGDADGWQSAFDLALQYVESTESYRAGILRLADMLDQWNDANMGEITLEGLAPHLIAGFREAASTPAE